MAATDAIVLRPQPGPQEHILASSADIVIAGGGAGGGKTWSLLAEPLRHVRNPEFGAVLFRRDTKQIRNEGGLWDESLKIYKPAGGVARESTLEWAWPRGMRVSFAHMEYAKDRFAWDGSQIPLIGFDQLESFEEIQFWYMLSRNRSTCGVRPYIRATCNPVPDDDPIGGWLTRLIAWWIDQDTGYAIPERSGVVRWFVRIGEMLHWGDTPDALKRQFADLPPEDIQPKSLTFIPARLDDNKILLSKDPGYRANLLALSFVERERLLGGNWKVRPTAGNVFNRSWFEIVPAAPARARRARGWDKAATKGAGDFSAGVKIAEADGIFYIEDSERGQWSSMQRNRVMRQKAESDGPTCRIEIEQEPGSSGKESAEISVRDLSGYRVYARTSTGDKVTRARAMSAQAEAGNIKLVRGPWNEAFLNEYHRFPDGGFDDQVDGGTIAFNSLVSGPRMPPGALDVGSDKPDSVGAALMGRRL